MRIQLKFEPRDLWIGAYWNLTKSIESLYRRLDIYICIVPTLPIHLCFEWGWRIKMPDEEYRAAYQKFVAGLRNDTPGKRDG